MEWNEVILYLELYITSPLGVIRIKLLGVMSLWSCPSFSLEKKRSGTQILVGSVKSMYFGSSANTFTFFSYLRSCETSD